MKTGVGFDLPEGEAPTVTGMEVLTGDTNIISVAMTLQYVIRNPAAFLFDVESPQALIGSVAESVLTETVVGMPVDEVLTTGRLGVQGRVRVRTQEVLDRYGSGVLLTSGTIMTIALGDSAARAFAEDGHDAAAVEEEMHA